MKKLSLFLPVVLIAFFACDEAEILPERPSDSTASVYSPDESTAGARTMDDPADDGSDDPCERDPAGCPSDGASGGAEPEDDYVGDPKFGKPGPKSPVKPKELPVYDKIKPALSEYRAGYVKDFNSSQLFPGVSFIRSGNFTIDKTNIYVLGSLSARPGSSAYIITNGRRLYVNLGSSYLSNGDRMGIYVLNVILPGGARKAALFDAETGSSLGWYYATISGAPTLQYQTYIEFLQHLNRLRY